MPREAIDLLLKLPPRLPSPTERQLLQEWLSAAGDVASAYLSERKGDDPAIYRRFVIAAGPGDQPTHFIHSPSGLRVWIMLTLGEAAKVEMFDSLRSALHSIRAVPDRE